MKKATPPHFDLNDHLEASFASLRDQFEGVALELKQVKKQLNRASTELKQMTDYLDCIIDSIAQGILFIDFNGYVYTYNSTAEALLDVEAPLVLSKEFWTNFRDDLLGFSLREALKSKKAPEISYASIVSERGEQCDLEIHSSFMLNEKGKQGIAIAIRDITQIRRLQIIANQNDCAREIGQVASLMAHEIRNPLTGIKGFASILEESLESDAKLKKMATHIVKGADTLNDLVTHVSHYAHPIRPLFKTTDLVAMTHELIEGLNGKDIHFSITSSESPFMIPIDPHLFKSALFHLLTNSIQASPDGGTITISMKKTGDNAQIVLSDTGEGISEENMRKIFSPFFSTRSNQKGFGLAEARKIVQAHNGTIDIKSNVNRGTTVIITCPVCIYEENYGH